MTQKKNICITINSLGRGGAEKQCLLLAKVLNPIHNTTVVVLNREPFYKPRLEFLEEEGLQYRYLTKNPLKRYREFVRFLKKSKIDIIFSFLPTDTIFSAICGKIAGTPNLFGGIRNSYMPRVKFTALRIVNNYFLDYTIANNFAAYESALDFGFRKKVFVIHNGIHIRPLVNRKTKSQLPITIISMGRLVEQKGYETAIKTIAELKGMLEVGVAFNYKILGQGPEQENIEGYIRAYDVSEEVQLVTDPSDIYDLLESSQLYLCTSHFEGISNSIMEAMNCALPIVATDAGDNSKLVIDGENGFLTAIGDHKALARHLNNLINSPAMRSQMGARSHAHLVKYFSYETFQKNYLHLVENIDKIHIENGNFVIHDTLKS